MADRGTVRTIVDPTTLRALAHPLRLTLLDLIDREGNLTATRAAELTGENSANCSFHLRQLAKRGFIERAPAADGRERPWRRAVAGERVPETHDPQLLEASAAVASLMLERTSSEANAFFGTLDPEDAGWQDASFLTRDLLQLRADELRALSRDIAATIERHARAASARRPPADARAVRVAAALFPLPPLR